MKRGMWRKLAALLTTLALLLACVAFATEEEPAQQPEADAVAVADESAAKDAGAATVEDGTVTDDGAGTDVSATVDDDAATDGDAATDDDADDQDEVVTPEALTPPDAIPESDGSGIAPVMLAPTDSAVAPTPTSIIEVESTPAPSPGVTDTPEPDVEYNVPCTDAGHSWTTLEGPVVEEQYEQISDDATFHKGIKIMRVDYECSDPAHGGKTLRWTTKTTDVTYLQHDFDESSGKCKQCEFQCNHGAGYDGNFQCKNCGMYCRHDWDTSAAVSVCKVCGATCQHYWDSETGTCNSCGKQCSHQWSNGSGYCDICRMECKHEKVTFYENPSGFGYGEETIERIVPIDSKYHEYIETNGYFPARCDNCGFEGDFLYEGERSAGTEIHFFTTQKDGTLKCYCGYVYSGKCKHSRAVQCDNWYERLETAVDNRDGKTHRVECYPQEGRGACTYCPDCGTWWDITYVGDPVVLKKDPHQWLDGVCWVCGAKQPAPAAKPTPTPAPQVTEVPADEPVHGVAVADDLRMGVALTKVMEGLSAESGDGTLLEIEDADRVLTGDENAQLRWLKPEEQMLVLLQVLGLGGEGDNAVSELGLTLSVDAQELLASIQARLDAMTAEDAAAFADLLARCFPVVDGKMEITLLTNVNGWQRERYTFEQVNGEWMFVKLTIIR